MAPIRVLISDSQRLFSGALSVALGQESDLYILEERPQSGAEAVDAIEIFRPDVAVLDSWLDSFPGAALTRRILYLAPDCKVVALSWMASVEQIHELIAGGAAAFLLKSDSVSKLAAAIRRAHAGESPVFADELQRLVRNLASRSIESERFEAAIQSLSPREFQVLLLLGSGRLIEEISRELKIAPSTVTSHINAILKKTGAKSHSEVLAMARNAGILQG